jgi:hypothetical protein
VRDSFPILETRVLALLTAVVLSIGTVGLADQWSGVNHRGSAGRPPAQVSQQMPAGNIEVFVPPVPPHPSLRVLCTQLLAGHSHSPKVQQLVGATGGTLAASRAWCAHYLHPKGAAKGQSPSSVR